jgi:hypothetical protein
MNARYSQAHIINYMSKNPDLAMRLVLLCLNGPREDRSAADTASASTTYSAVQLQHLQWMYATNIIAALLRHVCPFLLLLLLLPIPFSAPSPLLPENNNNNNNNNNNKRRRRRRRSPYFFED